MQDRERDFPERQQLKSWKRQMRTSAKKLTWTLLKRQKNSAAPQWNSPQGKVKQLPSPNNKVTPCSELSEGIHWERRGDGTGGRGRRQYQVIWVIFTYVWHF